MAAIMMIVYAFSILAFVVGVVYGLSWLVRVERGRVGPVCPAVPAVGSLLTEGQASDRQAVTPHPAGTLQ